MALATMHPTRQSVFPSRLIKSKHTQNKINCIHKALESNNMTSRVQTNAQAPALNLPTLSGETFNLSNEKPDSLTIVVFYRGLHWPICINYLQEIEENFETLTKAGINLVAVSMDPKEKARATVDKVATNMDLSDSS